MELILLSLHFSSAGVNTIGQFESSCLVSHIFSCNLSLKVLGQNWTVVLITPIVSERWTCHFKTMCAYAAVQPPLSHCETYRTWLQGLEPYRTLMLRDQAFQIHPKGVGSDWGAGLLHLAKAVTTSTHYMYVGQKVYVLYHCSLLSLWFSFTMWYGSKDSYAGWRLVIF